jgi:Subtilase family
LHLKQANSTATRVLIDNVRLFDKLSNILRSGTAFGHSALIVAAVGNEIDHFGQPPFVLKAAYPAATEEFRSVAALEQTGEESRPFRLASFSNAGAKIAGPGVGIVSSAPGVRLGAKSGTSVATAHVCGVAAVWAEKNMSPNDGDWSNVAPISDPAALSIVWRAALGVLVASTSMRPFISLSCSQENDCLKGGAAVLCLVPSAAMR